MSERNVWNRVDYSIAKSIGSLCVPRRNEVSADRGPYSLYDEAEMDTKQPGTVSFRIGVRARAILPTVVRKIPRPPARLRHRGAARLPG